MLPLPDERWTSTNHHDSMKLDQLDRLLLPNMPTKKVWSFFFNFIAPTFEGRCQPPPPHSRNPGCIFCLITSGGSRIFPGGGRQLPKVLLFFNFLPKTAWKWKNLDPQGGARVPGAPPWIRQWLRFHVHKIMTLSYELQFNKGVGTRKMVATKSNNISFYILNTKTCFALRPIYSGWKRKQKRKFSLTFVVYWFYLFACRIPKCTYKQRRLQEDNRNSTMHYHFLG